MTGQAQQSEWVRAFNCDDVAGRPRALKMFPNDDGRMVIQTPPGEVAVLTLHQLMLMNKAAVELFAEAQRRGLEKNVTRGPAQP